ncbi:MAG: hypothetical protein A2144_13260 [Chloroflexi bacterium RBG_16_50_9]|nr:MAG: hypothetical protein A2144_13260 [Chloroflexi bacterium RBG_16_50_9]
MNERRFIVDQNVGRLARWLRMMGYDSLFFNGGNDSQMVALALSENRVLLTRDTEIMKRRVITTGRLKAILINSEEPERQMRQLMQTLELNVHARPFTLCLECNQPLQERSREEVKTRVPPFVFKTQQKYMECPACHRIYWRGTHWQRMSQHIEKFASKSEDTDS